MPPTVVQFNALAMCRNGVRRGLYAISRKMGRLGRGRVESWLEMGSSDVFEGVYGSVRRCMTMV